MIQQPADYGRETFHNVQRYGALGDAHTLDTVAIQTAIDTCHEQGGGTVWVPAGQYLTGTILFRDNITLHLDAGATLLGSQDPADYPVLPNRWAGEQQPTYAPLIAGENLQNIAIVGRGTVNGRGETWWKAHREKSLAYPRPRLIGFTACTNVLIENITLINSPSWTINPVRCKNVRIHGVTITNPPDSPNTDGINPDSCSLVRISDCLVSVGDDCITLKSGAEHERTELRPPCRDITITNCTLERGHGGIVIGSEMSGGVENVVVSNCVFIGTDRGIRLKSRRGRGGTVENVRISNLIMDGVLCPFTMNLYYGCGAWGDEFVSDKSAKTLDAGTPRFCHIHISHVIARNAKIAAGFIYGLGEMPIEDISLSDISVSFTDGAEPRYPEMADGLEKMLQAGFFIRNTHHIRLDHVEVTNQIGMAFDLGDSTDVEINASGTSTPDQSAPIFRLQNLSDVCIHQCRAIGASSFLHFEGSKHNFEHHLTLTGNVVSPEQIKFVDINDTAGNL
jgi:polygalacturonase